MVINRAYNQHLLGAIIKHMTMPFNRLSKEEVTFYLFFKMLRFFVHFVQNFTLCSKYTLNKAYLCLINKIF